MDSFLEEFKQYSSLSTVSDEDVTKNSPNKLRKTEFMKDTTNVATSRTLNNAPAPGWTVHVLNDERLYYSNHLTRTTGWLPPAVTWKPKKETLPYGWERAIDESGKTYFINHLNRTTTYESPVYKNLQPPTPKPRTVILERSPSVGFGFVAGSEKPVIVRFVTEGGPSVDKLLPGDQIISVNGEDVKTAPREHVISLVRSSTKTVTLVVCQPTEQQGVRKSTFLSATKRARLKCKPARVRFAESVLVNGSPLFSPSIFTLGDTAIPPMANVLKVFLENGQTKSFKYNAWTKVQDVINSLQSKLCIKSTEYFSLVVEHIKSLKSNKLTVLDPDDTIAKIASQPGSHKLRCIFRVTFFPVSAANLAEKDLNALDYLYNQCCNDLMQERFWPELQHDTALKLAALNVCQHALSNNIHLNKLTVKFVESQFGLERFIPASIFEAIRRKEIKKLLNHYLKLYSNPTESNQHLSALQIKILYLNIASQFPSYGAKCFSVASMDDIMEHVILVSPKFGLSQITGQRNSTFQPIPISKIEDLSSIEVKIKDELHRMVYIILNNDKIVEVCLEDNAADELVLILQGYFRIFTGKELPVNQEKLTGKEDNAPPYFAEHKVVPEKWSYTDQSCLKSAAFAKLPVYQYVDKKTNGLYNTVGRCGKNVPFFRENLDNNMNRFSFRKPLNRLDLQQKTSDLNSSSVNVFSSSEECREDEDDNQPNNNIIDFSECQETNVDFESDSDEPGKLEHSDSLTLLNKIGSSECLSEDTKKSSVIESDSDSTCANNTPVVSKYGNNLRSGNEASFGLKSPSSDTRGIFQEHFLFDSDIIDLTLIPPPSTPDILDSTSSTPINIPPLPFADFAKDIADSNNSQDLETFLASVSIPPPTQKTTPAMELTSEEILAYIIPPPPLPSEDVTDGSISDERRLSGSKDEIPDKRVSDREETKEHNAYVTEPALLLPKRNIFQKPPDRPPKPFQKEPPRLNKPKIPDDTTESPNPELPPRIKPAIRPPRLPIFPKKLEIKADRDKSSNT